MNATDKTVLIMYDIVDNKRRRKIVKELNMYGERVQKSVFEVIATPAVLLKIQMKVEKIIDVTEDNVRIYPLNSYNVIIPIGVQYVADDDDGDDFGFVG